MPADANSSAEGEPESSAPSHRLTTFAKRWQADIDRIVETPSSFLGFGTWRGLPAVLKVARSDSDETPAGPVAAAFGAQGMVRVYESAAGVVLLERLTPGTPLVDVVVRGDDASATEILADVMATMHGEVRPTGGIATVESWGHGFDRYLNSGDRQIPHGLVADARDRYVKRCTSQRTRRLLHGDLQHYNVVYDHARGWIAIDPKGVVGELEYEIGPALRNPHEVPAVYSSPSAIERRLERYCDRLKLDPGRAIEWSYAQAVLSAIWTVEDHGELDERNPALVLAKALKPLLD